MTWLLAFANSARPLPDVLVDRLRRAVARTLDRAHGLTRDLLSKNRNARDARAEALFANGYLNRTEITSVFAQAPVCAHVATAPPSSPRLATSDRAIGAHRHADATSPTLGGAPADVAPADDDAPPSPHGKVDRGGAS